MGRFSGKVVLVSGGSRGIGFATAAAFAGDGADVVLFSRDADRVAAAAARIDGAIAVCGDVRSEADCARAVETAVSAHGRLDSLITSAGIVFRQRRIDEMSVDEWDETFDVNVKGAFLCSRAALPHLLRVGGNIVHVASYVGLVGFAGAAAYSASKAALVNLTRSMALDHAAEGVRVNCVCPGSVDTDMIREAWRAAPDAEAAETAWNRKHPLGRIGRPDEVARAILFLASDDASFVTGAAMPVDGGITAG